MVGISQILAVITASKLQLKLRAFRWCISPTWANKKGPKRASRTSDSAVFNWLRKGPHARAFRQCISPACTNKKSTSRASDSAVYKPHLRRNFWNISPCLLSDFSPCVRRGETPPLGEARGSFCEVILKKGVSESHFEKGVSGGLF